MVDENVVIQDPKEDNESPMKADDPEYHAKKIQQEFKQRCSKFMKKEMQKMTFID